MSGDGYNVYRVQYKLGMQDPLMGGGTRYHNVLFVETHEEGQGRIFHVIGDLVSGMTFAHTPAKKPEQSQSYHAKTFLGRIRVEDFPTRLVQVLEAVPPPHRQRAFNPKTMATEQIKPDGSFYKPDEQKPAYIKCTEWTEERAIPALNEHQLLHSDLDQAPLLEGSSQ